jgi:hypothetical protein
MVDGSAHELLIHARRAMRSKARLTGKGAALLHALPPRPAAARKRRSQCAHAELRERIR